MNIQNDDRVRSDQSSIKELVSSAPEMAVEELRFRSLRGVARLLFAVLTIATLGVALYQFSNASLLFGVVILDNRYYYLVATLVLPLVFLVYPARASAEKAAPTILDWMFAAGALGCGLYFVYFSEVMVNEGWEYLAPQTAIWISVAFWVVILEALRRTAGLPITIIALVVSLYPLVADRLPAPFTGIPQSFANVMSFHIIGSSSAFGVPMRAFADLVIGFLLFGVALNYTGGGKFMNDVAFALVGRWRGGAAQVGVISSMLQGSISGSVVSNVITSGVVTIPAMRRTRFSPSFAGGVEAVASTGGVLMPPVMGATAFLMASFLNIPYAQIALAAAVPALLFYFGLMVQIDAYSARRDLAGLKQEDLPRLSEVMKSGWIYLLVFAVLIWQLADESKAGLAPFTATGVLLVINQFMPKRRLTPGRAVEFLLASGRAIAEILPLMIGVGFVIGALTVTGMLGTLVNDLIFLAGDAPLLLLLMGAVASFVLGMGMTATACYIFLAATLAPPLVRAGLDPLGIHLFIFYWGMVSFITPPVAIAAFAAASLARANPFYVGFQAVRLGSVIYVVPFLFVLNPALILHGGWAEIAVSVAAAAVAVWLIGSSLQGYAVGFGSFGSGPASWLARALAGSGGLGIGVAPIVFERAHGTEITIAALLCAVAGLALVRGRRVAARSRAMSASM
ncbi:TRAP transporter permease [Propylenella binzhouense]|uniref:TRAP transporter fused permease subunit n=1 Tax=Propylenella binzhouense TaxID=2555902 RepID=A0A964T8A9_9HYPH|nr:TRAP transporter fused permease subunit [Propylenella binzhouense]MYZ50368.1 TRAP transporter fused permease subunit [Propylenella binzhouense]